MTTTIEKNTLENVDLLQIEYFSDLPVSKSDIVVVEHSDPIVIMLRKFLINIGFKNIYVCRKPSDGLKIFSDFINNEINVPIIIDDNTSAGNIKDIVREIFEIQPRANIIITTAKDKSSSQIIELSDMGVISILHKPINFEILEKSLVNLEKNNITKEMTTEIFFETLLSPYNQISFNRIQDILQKDSSLTESLVKKAIDDRILIFDKEIVEATCKQCGSSNIAYISECPECKGINFNQQILLEHYSCGEVYPKEVGQTICPKCNKEIGKAGTDYVESTNYYVCNGCNDKFPKPNSKFVCLKCNNFFIESAVIWKKNKFYHINK
jgi:DNA-binding response OmpR family regulator